ncbi:alpha/beta hydrolase [Nocardia macrotermitis]|uniref:Tripeptidyl aminopeptidase n=1 Tax=Nocardia macrotermitis TaxID=2585198 RepID=A0A7K0D013_9NOCA|nr:alpha/beta hydrolase [Nocardia macrotermitis]MQY19069.1 Tripeptidyl aminopeptidase [Nocardia macrotermitis]
MPTRWFRWLVSMMGIVLVAGLTAGPAQAQDPLDRFYGQRLDWQSCHDDALDAAGARCAGVLVPLDYAHPDGRTLTLAISRIAATDPARRRGVLLSNPGGPGGPGLRTMTSVQKVLSADVRAQYDLIGMDPRGIGRSNPVNCAIPLPTLLFSAGFDVFGLARDTGVAAALAASCLAGDIDKLRNITTRNTARDMDVIRGALGVDRISYYGASYGTYLGAVYTQMFPSGSDRIVLDGAIDPDRYWVGMYQDMGPINEYALDDWAAWAARHDDEYHFGTTAPQVRAFVEDTIRRAAKHPVISLGSAYLVDEHTVPMMLLALLSNPKMNANLAEVVRMVSDGADGKPLDVAKLKSKISGAVPLEASGMAAVMCDDRAAPRDPAWYYRNIEAARPTQPVFGAFANNITACAYWPTPLEPATRVRNATPALVLATVHDTRTAYQGGLALHRDLTASRLVTLADTRIHGAFRVGLSPCLNDAVNTYLATGALPDTDITCEPDPEYFPK